MNIFIVQPPILLSVFKKAKISFLSYTGSSCSKLTMSLVNDSLNLHRVIRKYAEFFC